MARGGGQDGGASPEIRVPTVFRFVQRKGPLGRRFEVHSADGDLLGYAVSTKASHAASFFFVGGDGTETEAFRVTPAKPGKTFARAFRVLSAGAPQAPVGEVRKKEYRSVRKEEWFLFDAEGEPVGMITKDPPRLGPIQEMGAFRLFFPLTYRLHWGQAIIGTVQDRVGVLLNDHMEIDLSLGPPHELDHRLILAAVFCLREGERLTDRAELAADSPAPDA